MGIIKDTSDWVKDKANKLDQTVNPFRQVGDVIEAAAAPGQKGLPEAVERARTIPRFLGIDKSTPNSVEPGVTILPHEKVKNVK